jgi:hypothetical protein
MADDAASEEEPVPEREPSLGDDSPRSWLRQNRTLALCLGCVGLCGVIAVDIYFMLKSDARRSAHALSAATASGSVRPDEPSAALAPAATSSAAPSEQAEAGSEVLDYESDDGEPRAAKP